MKNKPKFKIFRVFHSKKAQIAVNQAIKVITSIVLGALLLTGGYSVINNFAVPKTSDKITNMFAYDGVENIGGSGGGSISDNINNGGTIGTPVGEEYDNLENIYQITSGAGQTFNVKEGYKCEKCKEGFISEGIDVEQAEQNVDFSLLSFMSDIQIDKFETVIVDEYIVDSKYYQLNGVNDNIKIDFNYDYDFLNLLSTGSHHLKIIADDGYAECDFNIHTCNDVLIGDVSRNGVINTTDLVQIKKIINNTFEPTPLDGHISHCSHCVDAAKTAADINRDGIINDVDKQFLINKLSRQTGFENIAYAGEYVTIRYDIVVE